MFGLPFVGQHVSNNKKKYEHLLTSIIQRCMWLKYNLPMQATHKFYALMQKTYHPQTPYC